MLLWFSSEYTSDLFYPFLKSVSLDNINPWKNHFQIGLLDSFPYHGFMLLLLAPFVLLGEIIGLGEFFLKIPLLISDICILYVLLKLLPHREKRIYFFYFLNPIVLYSTYIHSQLDIIPTALLFVSIYFITLKKLKSSSILFGLAIATKVHVIVSLPLILFYLYKKFSVRLTLQYLIVSIIILIVSDSPFILSEGFINMVLLNPKQSLLFDTFYNIGPVKILLPIAAIISVYLHFFNQNKVNNDLLFFYFGILFTATIFLIYPGPAWYMWMIPYVCIYFIQHKNENKTILLHAAFSISYLIFFIFFYISEYHDIIFLDRVINFKIHSEDLRDISFTILEVVLLAIMYAFYKYGVKSNSIYKKKTNLSVGIGGDSGSGKTRLLNNLKHILGDKLLQIEGDGEHKWERDNENWNKYTHLDPKANHIHKQAEAISQLKNNQTIYRSEYDHEHGKFTKPFLVQPKEFIVIAGLHPFYLPKLRKNIDLKIYVDTDERLRRHWKVLRDTKNRGYDLQKILKQIDSRQDDAIKYIHPQKEFSDMAVNFFSINSFELGKKESQISMGLKITFDASIHVENILEKLNVHHVSWDYNDDLRSQYIELKVEPSGNFEIIAVQTIENIHEIISPYAKWESGYDGFIQLMCIHMISEKLKENKE